jgi:hypothetical protein
MQDTGVALFLAYGICKMHQVLQEQRRYGKSLL